MSPALRLTAVVAAVAATGAVAVVSGAAAPAAAPPMPVTLEIRSLGQDGVVTPATFAVRAGGTVRLTLRNDTALFHTFTVKELGISVLLRPHRATTITFVPPYGVYHWRCVLCPSSAHPRAHPMRGTMYAIVNL